VFRKRRWKAAKDLATTTADVENGRIWLTVIIHSILPHTLFTVGVNPTSRSTGDAPGNGGPRPILVRLGGKKI
jgi:hypothetical protein